MRCIKELELIGIKFHPNEQGFEPSLVNAIENRFPDKVMFGSDYPVISPVRWMDDWQKRGFSDRIHDRIFFENAKRILKLDVPITK